MGIAAQKARGHSLADEGRWGRGVSSEVSFCQPLALRSLRQYDDVQESWRLIRGGFCQSLPQILILFDVRDLYVQFCTYVSKVCST